MTAIILQSGDGAQFTVPLDVARVSQPIRKILDNLADLGENTDCQIFPIDTMNGRTLEKIITWMAHHKDDAPTAEDEDHQVPTTDRNKIYGWDAEFLNVDHGTLFEIMLAANHLDIKGLLDLTCKVVAHMIEAKTPEEIRKTFNIKNDFTPKEEQQIKEENKWVKEEK